MISESEVIGMADTGIDIRDMGEEDVEGILSIERDVKGNSRAVTYAPVPDSCVGGEIGSSVVAEENGRIVGFVLGRVVSSPLESGDIAWIELIGIHPEYQSKGIGKRMVEAWKDRCRAKGIRKVHIMVNWRDWWMQSFFVSLGFCRGDLVDFQAEL
jgi:N-acetylglutamate synthase-like GNAT family acetyltransferase